MVTHAIQQPPPQHLLRVQCPGTPHLPHSVQGKKQHGGPGVMEPGQAAVQKLQSPHHGHQKAEVQPDDPSVLLSTGRPRGPGKRGEGSSSSGQPQESGCAVMSESQRQNPPRPARPAGPPGSLVTPRCKPATGAQAHLGDPAASSSPPQYSKPPDFLVSWCTQFVCTRSCSPLSVEWHCAEETCLNLKNAFSLKRADPRLSLQRVLTVLLEEVGPRC